MTPTKQDSLGVHKHDKVAMLDQANPHGDLVFLAQAAASERATTTMHAMVTHWRAFCWCLFLCIGPLLWGFDSSTNGALLGVPQFRLDFGYIYEGQPVIPASWQSAFNSVSAVGGMFGSLSLGWVSDRLGRRGAVGIASVISIVGVLLQFLTPKHANGMLLAGKIINGYALGMYVSCAGSYCAEVSPLALRGITTASVNFWVVVGQLLSNGVLRATGNWTNVYAYRLPIGIQWIFPISLLIGLPFAPESPWWLVRKGRHDEAEYIISRLGGPTVDVKLHLRQIQETIQLEDSYAATASYIDCFRGPNRDRTIVAMMVFVLQQCSGIGIVFFGTYFFELAGFATSNAFDLSVGVNAIGLIGNLSTFYAVNGFGRRFLFNWGMMACTVITLLVGFIWIGSANQAAKWAVSVLTIIFNFVYQATIGPLGFVIFAEVPSAKLRSKTVGIGIWANLLAGMLSGIIFPYLINPNEANLGGYVGFIFGGLGLAGTIWAYFYIPETKGRTVDELDSLYEKRVPARLFGSYDLYEDMDATNTYR